jgi:hypothetical protein
LPNSKHPIARINLAGCRDNNRLVAKEFIATVTANKLFRLLMLYQTVLKCLPGLDFTLVSILLFWNSKTISSVG